MDYKIRFRPIESIGPKGWSDIEEPYSTETSRERITPERLPAPLHPALSNPLTS